MKMTTMKMTWARLHSECSEANVDVWGLGIDFSTRDQKTPQPVPLEQLPVSLLQHMLKSKASSPQQKKLLTTALENLKFSPALFNNSVNSLIEFFALMRLLASLKRPVLKMTVAKREYPIIIGDVRKYDGFFGTYIYMTTSYNVCDFSSSRKWNVEQENLTDPDTGKFKTLGDVLAGLGLFPFTTDDAKKHKARASRAASIANRTGTVLDVTSAVLMENTTFWGKGLMEVQLGFHGRSRQVIVEPTAETDDADEDEDSRTEMEWPFVRVFSLDLKRYVFVDVDDFKEHEFDKTMRDKLVLPAEMKSVLYSVFDAPDTFRDIFSDRGGGMVILTNGPSGVGKTLTAEVFAEYAERPLYVMEMGELGTNLEAVEASLQRIFHRAARWNAVLLFDEADIFMSKRSEHDLERSAIVGVFLRLLDRYHGMFFLTTNRAEVIDPAFCSRVTLAMDYPSLNVAARLQVWRNMLSAAGFECPDELLQVVAACNDINGRQIRNQVRLLRVLYPTATTITAGEFDRALKYVARSEFDQKKPQPATYLGHETDNDATTSADQRGAGKGRERAIVPEN